MFLIIINNYIEYESRGDKNKNLSVKEYLNMIRPYLSDMINHHKTHGKWKVHSGNKVIDYKTEGKLKIQLTMAINFMPSEDSEETRTMHTKSHNLEIMMGVKQTKSLKNFLNFFAKISRRIRRKNHRKRIYFR